MLTLETRNIIAWKDKFILLNYKQLGSEIQRNIKKKLYPLTINNWTGKDTFNTHLKGFWFYGLCNATMFPSISRQT